LRSAPIVAPQQAGAKPDADAPDHGAGQTNFRGWRIVRGFFH
jgi:hypothetical protein